MSIVSRLVSAVPQLPGAVAGVLVRMVGGSGAPSSARGGVRSRAGRAVRAGAAVSALCALYSLLALGSAPALADSCANAQFRTGYSGNLPNCRAFEQVTPVNKDSNPPYLTPPNGGLRTDLAAADGGAMAWTSMQAMPGSQADGINYRSTRGANGWSTVNEIPPQSTSSTGTCLLAGVYVGGYSPDLSSHVLLDGGGQDAVENPPSCGQDDPALVPGEPQGVQNMFLDGPGGYQLLTPNPLSGSPGDAIFCGGSPDLGHVLLASQAQLTPDAPTGIDPTGGDAGPHGGPPAQTNLFDWSSGALHLINVLPDGTPARLLQSDDGGVCGGSTNAANQGNWGLAGWTLPGPLHAVSDDGSRIFFYYANNLYVRVNPDQPASTLQGVQCLKQQAEACTVQVDAPAPGAPGPGGGGEFWGASADGSKVFFTDGNKPTTDSTPSTDLYRFDTTSGQLTDLTTADPNGAGVAGVLGASEDWSYVYFVASGALAPGGQRGATNLYRWHDGTTTFIATLDGNADSSDWNPTGAPSVLSSRVSPDGRYLAFGSDLSLTGAATNGTTQVYLYDAAAGKLACASCSPSGAGAAASSALNPPMTEFNFGGQTMTSELEGPTATLPRNLAVAPNGSARVFFQTTAQLLPQASNGKQNVYEFTNGQVQLISSGSSGYDDVFLDASANGNDVFLGSAQQLAPSDIDGTYDVYDARVGGGFPAPVIVPCSGEACQGTAGAAPAVPTAASITFSGPGDVTSAAPEPAGRARVLTRTVHGDTFLVRVSVPAPGRIAITGAGIRRASGALAHPGTFAVRVALTAKARRRLARSHRLGLMLHVLYTPAGGVAQAAGVSVTVLPASRHARRATIRKPGGAR